VGTGAVMSKTVTYEYASGQAIDEIDADDPLHGELMKLNMGPQHPATHGVLRLAITLDGETIHEVVPDVGYLHRGKEKSCETLGWRKFFPHTDRLDYVQPLMNNTAYALALEELAQLEVPERANIIRVLLMELSRIAAHLIYLGTTGIDLGAVTMFFFTFTEREKIYELLDAYTGHRMNNTYVRVGGVYADVDERVGAAVRGWLEQFPAKIDEFEAMLTGNRIWYDRNEGVGVLSREDAKAWSLTGPNLRGSGVDWDLRKKQPYSGRGLSNETTAVPNLVGMKLADAKRVAQSVYLNLGAMVYADTIATPIDSLNAFVWRQNPPSQKGYVLNLGASIDVWLSIDSALHPDTIKARESEMDNLIDDQEETNNTDAYEEQFF
jgi:hypothetical protein